MTKNYAKEKIELKEPDQSVVDFVLNYSKTLQICLDCKMQTLTILN